MAIATIRPYNASDQALLLVLELQGYEHPWREAEIAKHDANIHVITLEHKAIGYVCVETENNIAKLLRLTVCNNERRTGYGSRLMKFVEAEVANFRRITTIVAESNFAAQCFLRKHGWRCVNVMSKSIEVMGKLEDGYYFVRTFQQ